MNRFKFFSVVLMEENPYNKRRGDGMGIYQKRQNWYIYYYVKGRRKGKNIIPVQEVGQAGFKGIAKSQ